MRRILPVFFLLAMLTSLSYAQVYHWPLDKGVATQDIVGGKHGTTSLTGVSFVDDDERGEVMLLDGVDGFVTLPSDLFTDYTDATVTCWFNFYGGANWQRVYSFGHIDGPWAMFYFSPRDGWDGEKMHVTILGNNADPVRNWRDWNPVVIDTMEWHFSAAVFEAGTFKFYLDDQLVIDDDSVPATLGEIMVDPNEAYIGKSHWPDATFNGKIDDMRVYNSALTQAELQELMAVSVSTKLANPEPQFFSKDGRIEYKNLNETDFESIKVISITGQLVYRSEDISSLRSQVFGSGIYIVQLTSRYGELSKKVAVIE